MAIFNGTNNSDVFTGTSGDDQAYGFDGNDFLSGGTGNDTIDGGADNDYLDGESGNDIIYGGTGNDYIEGKTGNDILFGDAGADDLIGGDGNDILDGGSGVDDVTFTAGKNEVTIRHLKTGGILVNGPDGSDTLLNIENMYFADGVYSTSNFISSRPVPTYTVGAGTSTPSIYTGPVTFLEYEYLGNSSSEIVTASSGNDFLNLLAGDDAANGGLGDDVLDGGIGSNFLTGGGGNDTFFLDGRGGTTTWSTVTDFSPQNLIAGGDDINIWGWNIGTSKLLLSQENGESRVSQVPLFTTT